MIDDGGEWWFKESMKITLFALFTALLMIGCGSPNVDDPETLDKIIAEAVEEDKLQKRGKEGEELFYAPNKQTPYTGWSKSMYDDGQIKSLVQYKDGKVDGLWIEWFANGQKEEEANYKDGKLDGLVTGWYDNGQKKYEVNFKDDKLDGLTTSWDEHGLKSGEGNYKDGKLIED
jgi:antitoxin component YwqK of YwqJK toxin-antitoxin module